MVLIFPTSTCAICGGLLDRPYTATSGVPFLAEPRLWRYYDAPLHYDCVATWADREAFARGLFVSRLCYYWSGGGTLLEATPEWFLASGPADADGSPHYASVFLADWPIQLYTKWGEWDAFVRGEFRDDLIGPALDAAEAVMAEVRGEVPSQWELEALLAERSAERTEQEERSLLVEFGDFLATLWGEAAHEWDWVALEEQRLAAAHAMAEEKRLRAEAIARSNAIARRLAVELLVGDGLTCPHCRGRTRQMRFFDPGPDARSYFVCGLCGRSFAGSEATETS